MMTIAPIATTYSNPCGSDTIHVCNSDSGNDSSADDPILVLSGSLQSNSKHTPQSTQLQSQNPAILIREPTG